MRLQRYILKELLTQFTLVLLLVTGVFFAGMLMQFLHKFPEVGLVGVLKAAPFIIPLALLITLPLAFLVACLLTYGRFSDDNEFLAMRMGGIHPWHAVAPALVVGVLLSMASLHLNTTVIPLASLSKKTIGRDQLARIERVLDNPARSDLELGRSVELSWNGRDGKWLLNPLITYEEAVSSTREGGKGYRLKDVTADRCHISLDQGGDRLVIHLRNVEFQQENPKSGAVVWVQQAEHSIAFVMDELLDESELKKQKDADEMRATELLYRMRHGIDRPDVRREFAAEYWKRIAMGMAPLVFALLGTTLGLVTARGSRMAALMTAIGIALPVYYPLLEWGEVLALEGSLPAPVALGLGDVILAGVGLVLLTKVVRR